MNLKTSPKHILEKVYLGPGQIHITDKPTIIWTVLGSCVSVILYHQRSNLTAMCHAQLPHKLASDKKCNHNCPNPCYKEQPAENSFKFLTCSLNYMIQTYSDSGIPLSQIEATILGGSSLMDISNDILSVGERNINQAREFLNKRHIKIQNENLGGKVGRTIWYNTQTHILQVKMQNQVYEKEKLF